MDQAWGLPITIVRFGLNCARSLPANRVNYKESYALKKG